MSAATISDISFWFDRGVIDGRRFMVIICDKFDWEDYPEYFDSEDAARSTMSNPGTMHKFMEAYDLKADKALQMAARRFNCFRDGVILK